MKTGYLLFIVLATMSVVRAQVNGPKRPAPLPIQSVVNEDRGRACIVVDDSLPGTQGAKFTVESQQHSIFLGKGWAADSLRARESDLSNLLSNASDAVQIGYFEQFGWKNLYSVNNYEEKPVEIGVGGLVSDLQIQSVLSGMIADAPIVRSGGEPIYVIYLEPALTSTLGPIIGGKHFLAYYNAFNRSGMRIRYVVVPYGENLKTLTRKALIGFISAIAQPDCGS